MIVSIITGILAGAIAGKIMKYEVAWWKDLIMGLLGGTVGGWVADLINIDPTGNWILRVLFAVIGACIITYVYRWLTGKKGKSKE